MQIFKNRPGTARKEGIGQNIKRLEDPRMITGQGTYIDDIKMPGLLYMQIVRSTEAHARILEINTQKAVMADGVYLVLTGTELNRAIRPLPVDWEVTGLRCRNYPVMADAWPDAQAP